MYSILNTGDGGAVDWRGRSCVSLVQPPAGTVFIKHTLNISRILNIITQSKIYHTHHFHMFAKGTWELTDTCSLSLSLHIYPLTRDVLSNYSFTRHPNTHSPPAAGWTEYPASGRPLHVYLLCMLRPVVRLDVFFHLPSVAYRTPPLSRHSLAALTSSTEIPPDLKNSLLVRLFVYLVIRPQTHTHTLSRTSRLLYLLYDSWYFISNVSSPLLSYLIRTFLFFICSLWVLLNAAGYSSFPALLSYWSVPKRSKIFASTCKTGT